MHNFEWETRRFGNNCETQASMEGQYCSMSAILPYVRNITLCPQYYSMSAILLYVRNITLCPQYYSMSAILLYVRNITLCPQYYSMSAILLYVRNITVCLQYYSMSAILLYVRNITLCPQCIRENGVKLTKLIRCLQWGSFECDHEYFDFIKEKFFLTRYASDNKCLKIQRSIVLVSLMKAILPADP